MKLRHLLVDVRKQQLPYTVCLADDTRGPGGGIYVKAHTPVSTRRAWTRLAGHVAMSSPSGRRSGRMVRVDVDGYLAGSLGHNEDGASPHLIALFAPGSNDRPKALEKVSPQATALWERGAGPDHRCYGAGGRFKSMLSWEVTGFLGQEEYERVLGPYDRALRKRLG